MVCLAKLGAALGLCSFVAAFEWHHKRSEITECLDDAEVPYDKKNTTAWKADVAPFNLRLPYEPVAIAVPQTVDHIQDAVKCGVQSGVRVSPKCGGHSYASLGFGGEDGQLVIELDRMSKVTVRDDNTATVQGGARLGHVAVELYDQGKRAIPHGTCPGVGISGHGLHGGYGMIAHTRGLTLDWMIGATVILADGSKVHCSATENKDLFWALRGAGSSFGIVAEFEFNTFQPPANVTYYQINVRWNETQTVKGLKAVQEYAEEDMPAELNMRVALAAGSVSFEGVYYGNKTQLQAAVAPLLKQTNGTLASSTTTTWIKGLEHYAYGLALNQTNPYNQHETFYSTSLTSPALTDDQLKSFVSYMYHNSSTGGGFGRRWWIQMDLHGGANSAVAAVPNAATAYAHRDQLLLFQFYDSIFVGDYPDNGFSLLQNFVKSVTKSMDDGEYGKYINYADSQLSKEDANHLYWRGNLDRLRKIKKQLDPREVFWNPSSVRPA